MRIANVNGRAVLLDSEATGYDIASLSGGKFGPSLESLYSEWPAFRGWTETGHPTAGGTAIAFSRRQLEAPSPAPRQVIAVGLNYTEHAAESGFEAPTDLPPTFTKFVSSITGPDTTVILPPGGNTDWEVELVAVIGRTAHAIDAAAAWDHVAGLTIGQDISERVSQLRGPAAQFSLGKSFPGFAPIGPWLVTTDELDHPDDLALGCSINGEAMQNGRTRDLIFTVPRLVSELSQIITLYPGDVIFTGTPAGVGVGREPQRFIRGGDTLVSWIEGIGEMTQTFQSNVPQEA